MVDDKIDKAPVRSVLHEELAKYDTLFREAIKKGPSAAGEIDRLKAELVAKGIAVPFKQKIDTTTVVIPPGTPEGTPVILPEGSSIRGASTSEPFLLPEDVGPEGTSFQVIPPLKEDNSISLPPGVPAGTKLVLPDKFEPMTLKDGTPSTVVTVEIPDIDNPGEKITVSGLTPFVNEQINKSNKVLNEALTTINEVEDVKSIKDGETVYDIGKAVDAGIDKDTIDFVFGKGVFEKVKQEEVTQQASVTINPQELIPAVEDKPLEEIPERPSLPAPRLDESGATVISVLADGLIEHISEEEAERLISEARQDYIEQLNEAYDSVATSLEEDQEMALAREEYIAQELAVFNPVFEVRITETTTETVVDKVQDRVITPFGFAEGVDSYTLDTGESVTLSSYLALTPKDRELLNDIGPKIFNRLKEDQRQASILTADRQRQDAGLTVAELAEIRSGAWMVYDPETKGFVPTTKAIYDSRQLAGLTPEELDEIHSRAWLVLDFDTNTYIPVTKASYDTRDALYQKFPEAGTSPGFINLPEAIEIKRQKYIANVAAIQRLTDAGFVQQLPDGPYMKSADTPRLRLFTVPSLAEYVRNTPDGIATLKDAGFEDNTINDVNNYNKTTSDIVAYLDNGTSGDNRLSSGEVGALTRAVKSLGVKPVGGSLVVAYRQLNDEQKRQVALIFDSDFSKGNAFASMAEDIKAISNENLPLMVLTAPIAPITTPIGKQLTLQEARIQTSKDFAAELQSFQEYVKTDGSFDIKRLKADAENNPDIITRAGYENIDKLEQSLDYYNYTLKVTPLEWATAGAVAGLDLLVLGGGALFGVGLTRTLVTKGVQATALGVFVPQQIRSWGSLTLAEKGLVIGMDALLLTGASPLKASQAGRAIKRFHQDQRGFVRMPGAPKSVVEMVRTTTKLSEAQASELETALGEVQQSLAQKSPFRLLDAARNLKRVAVEIRSDVMLKYADDMINNPNGYVSGTINATEGTAIEDIGARLQRANDVQQSTNLAKSKTISIEETGLTESQYVQFLKQRVINPELTLEQFKATLPKLDLSLITKPKLDLTLKTKPKLDLSLITKPKLKPKVKPPKPPRTESVFQAQLRELRKELAAQEKAVKKAKQAITDAENAILEAVLSGDQAQLLEAEKAWVAAKAKLQDLTEKQLEIVTQTKTVTEQETKLITQTETVTEMVTQPETQTQTQTELVTETVTEPKTATQTETETVTEPVTKTVTQTETKPITQTQTQTVVQPVVKTITQTVTEPVTETVPEPVTATITEPVTETVVQPVTVTEVIPEPIVETITEPVIETGPEPPVIKPPVKVIITPKNPEPPKTRIRGSGPVLAGLDGGKRKRLLPSGSVAWKQNTLWRWIPQNEFNSGSKPRVLPFGVIPAGAIKTDGETPEETIQVIGDRQAIPETINVDLGDVVISNFGRSITFNRSEAEIEGGDPMEDYEEIDVGDSIREIPEDEGYPEAQFTDQDRDDLFAVSDEDIQSGNTGYKRAVRKPRIVQARRITEVQPPTSYRGLV